MCLSCHTFQDRVLDLSNEIDVIDVTVEKEFTEKYQPLSHGVPALYSFCGKNEPVILLVKDNPVVYDFGEGEVHVFGKEYRASENSDDLDMKNYIFSENHMHMNDFLDKWMEAQAEEVFKGKSFDSSEYCFGVHPIDSTIL